ncbi:prepilin peptidase [Natribacillus halophilus]|uniref:Type 4 prepilin peptidase 1 Aspartic peptidase. MEROPS family A24A n=1 Tax=Natribacillus halophilus TaxID=549003 RepID=A0A1G8QAF8_9BACI|nr:prepilin peptidase [Natribacillus halophilus]SDJ01774.1 type 4 prepilin peptidase 1 Aspartic peptidase. MEROPS family A24A [Natribacillus halophilus]
MLSIFFLHIPFALIILFSAFTDLKKRLIYDKVTIPGMVYFLIFNAIIDISHFHHYLLGGLLLGGIHLFLAVVSQGQIGGGDIKLFALIGFAMGGEAGFTIFIYTYLIAGLWAIPYLIYIKVIRKQKNAPMVPLAPFIALGVLVFYLLQI